MKYRKICDFQYPGEPLTKGNNKTIGYNKKTGKPMFFGKGKKILAYEQGLIAFAKTLNLVPISRPIRITVIYYLSTRRIKDLPNLPKTTMDALIGSIYTDDYYICEQIIKKLYDKTNPRIHVIAEEIIDEEEALKRTYPITIGELKDSGSNNAGNKPITRRKKKSSSKSITKRNKPNTRNVDSNTKTKTLSTATGTKRSRSKKTSISNKASPS